MMNKWLKTIGWVIVSLIVMYFLYSIGGSHKEKEIKREIEEIRDEKDSIRKALLNERHVRLTIQTQIKKEAHRSDSIKRENVKLRKERNWAVRDRQKLINSRNQLEGDEIYSTWIQVYEDNKHTDIIDLESIVSGPGEN